MTFVQPSELTTIAEIGVGTVGASWSALMLAKGLHVRAFDPAPDARDKAISLIRAAWPSLRTLQIATDSAPPLDRLSFHPTIEEAVSSANVVQENTPETLENKKAVFARIGAAAGSSVIILSSTGGMIPSDLQELCPRPERVIVFHPFNPTHLIPLVEVVAGKETAVELIEWAMEFARFLGKKPIRLDVELVGHMTNRLQFALVREAVRCIVEGVASARDVDAAVRYGLAPRWMLMGGLQTLHLAGGYGGMRGILDHAGAAIEDWWRPGDEIRLTDAVKSILVDAGTELSNGSDIGSWMDWRDAELVEMLRAQRAAECSQPGQLNQKEMQA
ncbi:MAG: 3-hydroxyacyl-CoA dehydrogenase NAD-binding domain-containing protein [Hyphomonas sp.]